MNTRFTVGEMAKLNNISKQTLIFYDKEGIFKPKNIDPINGYRYYTADQLEVLDSILILKEMGLPLKAIREFMENRNSESAISLMQDQQKEIKNKIKNLKLINKRLERKVRTLEDFSKNKKNVSFMFCNETEYLAIEKVGDPQDLLHLDIALKILLNKADKFNYPHYYQIGAMVPVGNILSDDYTSAHYAFIPLESKLANIKIHKKIKGTYASIYHIGTYPSIGESYKKLLNEISAAGYRPQGYSYEYCILDSLTSKESDDYVTEIQILVKKV
ncbi:MAG: MerR family transcriptional regulator [Clostridium cadaveris]|uniref:Transcriptional regulator n=1 Tax=Clostridium cadaveris TaxID=1529 RepID=A0A316MMA8_9CLOT|nr:MerR family transcriptional regulator [Clostridium cadaveris]MDY4948782.1 MerR family transcriptional regulator [Clostridium cadaveris]NWK11921.1 MerR family transcriptional regulator [Clostridium cadaveris]PWL53690.1 MAG: transcriptional regulator [Clostridium cadaveris]